MCHAVWVIWLCVRDGLRGQLGQAGILVLCVVVLMLGAGGGMIWAGVRMTKAFARAVTINILIDSEGVSIGDTTYPWECIAWIGGRRFFPFSVAVSLCFVMRGNPECGYHVPLNPHLTRTQFDDLMRKIASQVQILHADLEVGRIKSRLFKLTEPVLPR